jgi:hypothetical protein
VERRRGLRGGHHWVGQSQAGSVAHRRDCPRQAEEETRERKGLLKKANAEEEGRAQHTARLSPLPCRPALVYRPRTNAPCPCRKPPAAAPEVLTTAAAPSASRRRAGKEARGAPTHGHPGCPCNHKCPVPHATDSPCTVRGVQQSQRDSRQRHTSRALCRYLRCSTPHCDRWLLLHSAHHINSCAVPQPSALRCAACCSARAAS